MTPCLLAVSLTQHGRAKARIVCQKLFLHMAKQARDPAIVPKILFQSTKLPVFYAGDILV